MQPPSQAQEKSEEGAVRVPYVPQIVKDQIRKEVAAELVPQVTKEVVEQAKSEAMGRRGRAAGLDPSRALERRRTSPR